MKCCRISTRWLAEASLVVLLAAAGAIAPPAAAEESAAAETIAESQRSSLLSEATAFLHENASRSGVRLSAVSLALPEIWSELEGGWHARFRLARPVATGEIAVTAVVEQEGRPVRALLLKGELIVEGDLRVAARDLSAGTVLREADVRLESRVLARGLEPASALVQAVGREVRSAVREGETLTDSILMRPREVLRGEMVTLFAEGNGFKVRLLARAGRDGARGERIPVVNPSSGQTVTAEVVGRGIVRADIFAFEVGRIQK